MNDASDQLSKLDLINRSQRKNKERAGSIELGPPSYSSMMRNQSAGQK